MAKTVRQSETDKQFSKKQDEYFDKKAQKEKSPKRRSKALVLWNHQQY